MENKFYNYISNLLKDEPQVKYEWNYNKTELIFKKQADDGFNIIVSCQNDNNIVIMTNLGYHEHFEAFEKFEEILEHVEGVIRDLLSKKMRIVEILSNNKPRKWMLQFFKDGEWHTEATNGLFFWNYFGKKTEKIYTNDILPTRDL